MISNLPNSKSPEYRSWHDMKQRCLNPNNFAYGNYGGRGITVCERWIESFANFFEDMGLKPSRGYTIERIDNEKGYGPSNCKWVTRAEQAINRRVFKKSKSGITGVSWKQAIAKYQAQIQVNKQKLYLGVFSNIEDAIKARRIAELQYWSR